MEIDLSDLNAFSRCPRAKWFRDGAQGERHSASGRSELCGVGNPGSVHACSIARLAASSRPRRLAFLLDARAALNRVQAALDV